MSFRQELAAILMDHADEMPEQTYMTILDKLAKIPNHKDPIAAADLQKQLDEEREEREAAEESNELLVEQLHDADEYIDHVQRIVLAIMKSEPIFEDDECVVFNKYNMPTPAWNRSHQAVAMARQIRHDYVNIYARYLDMATQHSPDQIEIEDDRVQLQERPIARRLEFDDIDPDRDYTSIPSIDITENRIAVSPPCLSCLRRKADLEQRRKLFIVVHYYNKDIHNTHAKQLLHENEGWHEPTQSMRHQSRHTKRLNRFRQEHFQYTLIHHTPHVYFY